MTHRKTILVVDDIPLMRTILARYVNLAAAKLFEEEGGATGLDIVETGSAKQALDILRRESVDVLFLDLMMPEMDGMALLEVKKDDPAISSVPVVVCSALSGKETVDRALELGAASYLLKPYTLDSVDEKFRAALYSTQA